jgi:hypothetical protein
MWMTLLPLLGPLWVSEGIAGSAKAELQQLDEDVRILVDKNAWSGVERAYLQMTPLEARGARLTWEHHRWGALAAQARGDVMATWMRLRAAEAVESHEETLTWLATLEAGHGRAVIELSPLVFGEVAVESLTSQPDPAAQRTITSASATLSQTRVFDGLLPLGRYRIGAVQFDIDGGPLVRVFVEPGQARAKAEPAPPGTLRFVANAVPTEASDADRALEQVREAFAGTPGVAGVSVIPRPGRRLYADFAAGSLDSLGLTPTGVAQQIREGLGVRPTDVVVSQDSVGVPVAIGLDRLKAVPLVFESGKVTLGAVSRLREAPDRAAPPMGLLVQLTPSADPAQVREALLQRSASSALSLTTSP